jgi:5-carboxymethyl-2-hydroxymuconate isomerase
MPHIMIDASSNACIKEMLQTIVASAHQVMIDSGLCPVEAIQSRARFTDCFMVGARAESGSFLHIQIFLLEGRSVEAKARLAENMHKAIHGLVPAIDALSVNCIDMLTETYRK